MLMRVNAWRGHRPAPPAPRAARIFAADLSHTRGMSLEGSDTGGPLAFGSGCGEEAKLASVGDVGTRSRFLSAAAGSRMDAG